jgi:hypothetical protein
MAARVIRDSIAYRDFYDVLRNAVVFAGDERLLLDCAFDEEREEYPAVYQVFRLPNGYAPPSASVENIFLQSAPMSPTTAAETARIVAPSGPINVVRSPGGGRAQLGRLTDALGSRFSSAAKRAFTSERFAAGVEMAQFTVRGAR